MEKQTNTNFNYPISYEEYNGGNDYENANILERWFNPGYAEMGEFNRENYLMDKGNAFNEYMFDKANQWNSASAQMQRGKEAGINPMLLAAGISGSGATATPMQSQGASVGMNTNAQNPIDMANSLMGGIDTGMSAVDKLGKLVGFGKENKANIKVANETANKLGKEAKLTWWETKRLQRTFKDFVREAKANADAAEKHIEELQTLIDNYKADTELKESTKNLVDEQVNTQEQITEQERYKKWELQFKKQFRDKFGVQLNDSDASMLAQLILNGHGEELVSALSDMVKSIIDGIKKETPNIIDTIFGDGSSTNINKKRERNRIAFYAGEWDGMPKFKKRKYIEMGIITKEQYIHYKMYGTKDNGASSQW